LRGNKWEVEIPKAFLQEAHSMSNELSASPRLSELGRVDRQEFDLVLDKLAERLGL